MRAYFYERNVLNELMAQEETYWRQRAKVFWLEEGDTNSHFFHASASLRKKMNHISFLKNEEGMAISDNDGMCALVKEYFENVFAGSCEIRHNVAAGNDGLISKTQNANLVAEFSYEEFTIAVKQMHPKKASGPDGLNPAFFQH